MFQNQAGTPGAGKTKAASARESSSRTTDATSRRQATTSQGCRKMLKSPLAESARGAFASACSFVGPCASPSTAECAPVRSSSCRAVGSLCKVRPRNFSANRHGDGGFDVARRQAALVVARLHVNLRAEGVPPLSRSLVGAQRELDDGLPFVDRERLLAEGELARDGGRVDGLARRDAFLRLCAKLGRDVELVGGGVGVNVEAFGDVEPHHGLARAARREVHFPGARRDGLRLRRGGGVGGG